MTSLWIAFKDKVQRMELIAKLFSIMNNSERFFKKSSAYGNACLLQKFFETTTLMVTIVFYKNSLKSSTRMTRMSFRKFFKKHAYGQNNAFEKSLKNFKFVARKVLLHYSWKIPRLWPERSFWKNLLKLHFYR